jgi:branched-subunit amino acid permease
VVVNIVQQQNTDAGRHVIIVVQNFQNGSVMEIQLVLVYQVLQLVGQAYQKEAVKN